MTTPQLPADPTRFDLKSFADLLPKRLPLVGEDPDSFDGFRAGMMQSLLPATPYESVMAAALINRSRIFSPRLNCPTQPEAGVSPFIKKV